MQTKHPKYVTSRVLSTTLLLVAVLVTAFAWQWFTWPDRTWVALVDRIRAADRAGVNAMCPDGFIDDWTPDLADVLFKDLCPRPFNITDRMKGAARVSHHHPETGEIVPSTIVIMRGRVYFVPWTRKDLSSDGIPPAHL